jgi:hypothetical protein
MSVHQVKCAIFTETTDFVDRYNLFCQYPDNTHYGLFRSLNKYIIQKCYNQQFGDLAPVIAANALGVTLKILNESNGGDIRCVDVSPGGVAHSKVSTITIHRKQDHYSAVKPRQSYLHDMTVSKCLSKSDDQIMKPDKRVLAKRELYPKSSGANLANLCKIKCRKLKAKPINNMINFGVLNVRSCNNKVTLLNEYIQENNLDFLCITETWLKAGDSVTEKQLCPEGYKFIGSARNITKSSSKGGGVGLISKVDFNIEVLDFQKYSSFEYLAVRFGLSKPLVLVVIYRPPPSCKNKLKISTFMEDIEDLFGCIGTLKDHIVITGDFNLHWNQPEQVCMRKFMSILEATDFEQHIVVPTHKSGNTLDYIISRKNASIIKDVTVQNDDISDHFTLRGKLAIKRLTTERKNINIRKLKNIVTDEFRTEIKNAMSTGADDSVHKLVSNYNESVRTILDKHAPSVSVKMKGNIRKPWYTDTIHAERQCRRKMERKWRKSGLEIHRQMFRVQRNKVALLVQKAKSEYFKNELVHCDSKKLFKGVKSLVNDSAVVLPKYGSSIDLADRFVDYFNNKIVSIRNELDQCNIECDDSSIDNDVPALDQFTQVSHESFMGVFKKVPLKTCVLDPAPTRFLSQYHDILLPVYMNIVNASLASGSVPNELKHGVICPLIKKPGLDKETLKNYRPVSNLPFLAKVLEKVVAKQLIDHMDKYNLNDKFQSAYRAGHSCETTTLKLKNDISEAFDVGEGVLLVSLDLSAAFDTLDHAVLLERLRTETGVNGLALDWFNSYISNRTQSVVINETLSKCVSLSIGVPQGSILGPLLYNIYVQPLRRIFIKHQVKSMGYADDNFLYLRFKLNCDDMSKKIVQLEKCIEEAKIWMASNKLKVNDSKTEFIVFSPKHRKMDNNNCSLSVGETSIKPTDCMKILGALFDQHLTMEKQINSVIRSAYFQLRMIGMIKHYLDKPMLARIIHALFTSRIDHMNSLLVSVPSYDINRLQKVQNHAARLLSGARRCDHITPVLKSLHWLPVTERVVYKILITAHKCICAKSAPEYLCDLLDLYKPKRCLRSALDNTLLSRPVSKLAAGDRSFRYSAPRLWNSLPTVIREQTVTTTFKKSIKTFLFAKHFK